MEIDNSEAVSLVFEPEKTVDALNFEQIKHLGAQFDLLIHPLESIEEFRARVKAAVIKHYGPQS